MLVNDKNVFINFVFCLIKLKTVSVVKIIIIIKKVMERVVEERIENIKGKLWVVDWIGRIWRVNEG